MPLSLYLVLDWFAWKQQLILNAEGLHAMNDRWLTVDNICKYLNVTNC